MNPLDLDIPQMNDPFSNEPITKTAPVIEEPAEPVINPDSGKIMEDESERLQELGTKEEDPFYRKQTESSTARGEAPDRALENVKPYNKPPPKLGEATLTTGRGRR